MCMSMRSRFGKLLLHWACRLLAGNHAADTAALSSFTTRALHLRTSAVICGFDPIVGELMAGRGMSSAEGDRLLLRALEHIQ